MIALYLLTQALAALALVVLLNEIALRPWRRTAGEHWSVRASELWPARVGHVYNLLLVPLGVVALSQWIYSLAKVPWWYGYLTAFVGAKLGSWYYQQAVSPWVTWRLWINEWFIAWGLQALRIAFYILAILAVAQKLEAGSLTLALAVMAYDIWAARGGLLRFVRWGGYYRAAPPALERMVVEVATRMQVPPPAVWVVASTQANAFALILAHALVFTDALVENLDEDELKGIIAHELAHLAESPAARAGRVAGLLGVWPWLFVGPLVARFGSFTIVALVWWWVILKMLLARFSRRMETRADEHAVAQETGIERAYARALGRLHELNQIPAVTTKGLTHPHLYDRLLAAGVEPDFPRPEPPRKLRPFAFIVYLGLFIAVTLQLELFKEILSLLGQPTR